MKMLYKFNGGEFPEDYEGTKSVKKENLPIITYNKDGTIDQFILPWELVK